jgi:hypothetical protein
MNLSDKTPNQLATIAADALAELNRRHAVRIAALIARQPAASLVILDDWVEFNLLKAMAQYDDGVWQTFVDHCQTMSVDTDGYGVDEYGNNVGDGYEEQVTGDYRVAQMGGAA